MVFNRFKKSSETAASHAGSGVHNDTGTQDPVERARAARETQRRLGEQAILLARRRREELFGQSASNEAPTAWQDERTGDEEQSAASEEAAQWRAREAERQQREDEQRQEAARRQREELWRRQQEYEAEQRRRREAERQRREEAVRRQREASESSTRSGDQAEILRIRLSQFDTTLQSFPESRVRDVISHILSKRSLGLSDWNIHVGFHTDGNQSAAAHDDNFKISQRLLNGNGKTAQYRF